MKKMNKNRQQGISLIGVIIGLAILGVIAVLGMKIVPTVSEYMAVNKAITKAKSEGSTPVEIRTSFDKQADVAYITSITGKDLDVYSGPDGLEVSFKYDKVIPLVGPASLLIEYEGSTEKKARKNKAAGV